MGSITRGIGLWLSSQVKFVSIRLLAPLVRWAPFRVSLVETAGLLLGLVTMGLHIRQWRPIIEFARHSGNPLPAWSYVTRFFIQWARDRVWCEIYYEETTALAAQFTIEWVLVSFDWVTAGSMRLK